MSAYDRQHQRYGDWHIVYDPPPIPTRARDWTYYHDDYDGAPDARDHRCGTAPSPWDCRREIDEYEREQEVVYSHVDCRDFRDELGVYLMCGGRAHLMDRPHDDPVDDDPERCSLCRESGRPLRYDGYFEVCAECDGSPEHRDKLARAYHEEGVLGEAGL